MSLQKNKTRGIGSFSLSGAVYIAFGDKEIAVKICNSSHYRNFPIGKSVGMLIVSRTVKGLLGRRRDA